MTAPHLWHYTCAHGRAALGARGTLLPPCELATPEAVESVPPFAAPLLTMVWATDLDHPDAAPLGLTAWTIACDRTAYRYAVAPEAFTRWGRIRSTMPTRLVDALEGASGAEPARWWVAFGPVPAELREVTP